MNTLSISVHVLEAHIKNNIFKVKKTHGETLYITALSDIKYRI